MRAAHGVLDYNAGVSHADKAENMSGAAWTSLGDLTLMPEERVVSVFDVARGVTDGGREPSESLLLTSRRIIHVKGKGGRRRVVFLPLRNIDAIEIMRQPLGYGTFVWAALAVVVAVLVWQVWEHGLAPLASLIVIGMGGYLVVDRLLALQNLYVVVTSGSAQLRLELRSKDASQDIHGFTTRVFQLQEEVAAGGPPGHIRFPPR